MRRMISRRGGVLVLVLALALVAVACGGGGDKASTASSAAATAASGVSADQIVKDSEAKMATVNSASFTADLALKVQGDTSKMTDPTAKALLSQGITLHAEGKSANDPTAVDMTMSLGIAGQNLEFGMMSAGQRSRGSSTRAPGTRSTPRTPRRWTSRRRPAPRPPSSSRASGSTRPTWGTSYELVGHRGRWTAAARSTTSRPSADPQKLADVAD